MKTAKKADAQGFIWWDGRRMEAAKIKQVTRESVRIRILYGRRREYSISYETSEEAELARALLLGKVGDGNTLWLDR